MAAYAKLQPFVDTETFTRIVNYSLPSSHFKHLTYALNHMSTDGDGRCIASVGFIDAEDGDDISSTAEYLIRMDTLNLVIVWGIVDSSLVRVSARSKDISISLDTFLRRTFKGGGAKLSPDGIGVGGATLDLGIWACENNKTEICAMVSKKLEHLIFGDGH
jgi:nanoRNase/pAp phosphatase (c-di-AMP/oligoRNAs hydrolase)